jgi:hypothetical protein
MIFTCQFTIRTLKGSFIFHLTFLKKILIYIYRVYFFYLVGLSCEWQAYEHSLYQLHDTSLYYETFALEKWFESLFKNKNQLKVIFVKQMRGEYKWMINIQLHTKYRAERSKTRLKRCDNNQKGDITKHRAKRSETILEQSDDYPLGRMKCIKKRWGGGPMPLI